MAQAYFNSRTRGCQSPPHADSAGIAAFDGQGATIDAMAAMETLYHIDLSEHQSKPVTPARVEQADLVLAMTGMHKRILQEIYPDFSEKIYTLMEYAHRLEPEQPQGPMDIPDPCGSGETVYQETARCIAAQIDRIIEQDCLD